ncbi:MMPL family transporter [Streptomyces sp. NPDC006879]|uniref:MMPL family transporter n=1 Tax=Streptomyces sp. NPDC006879 TaxID=3364767 RepID=UPI0036AAD1E6
MADFLRTLGRLSHRRRWYITSAWIGLLILAGVLAGRAPQAPPTDFSMPGTEAQRAYDLLDERFPGQNAAGATARVVFHAEDGKVSAPEVQRAITETVHELGGAPQVGRVTDPFQTGSVSADGTTAYAQVTYQVAGPQLAEESRAALLATVQGARTDTLDVEVGGNAVSSPQAGHSSEVVGLAVAALVLIWTFGSLVAAGLPMLTALVGIGIGTCVIKVLAEPLGLGSTTSVLATMLGLAVGIDYALFVVSRYRAELASGLSGEDAAGQALGTAGSAVVFAGLTVVIALVGLTVVNIPLLTQMGLAAAGTVTLAVLIALTLVPALLGIAGNRCRPARDRRPRRIFPAPAAAVRPALGVRWARLVTRRPVPFLLSGTAVLALIAVPAASLELGLPDDGSQPAASTQRRAYDLLSTRFGPGYNGPLLVVVEASSGGDATAAAAGTARRVEQLDQVARVSPPRLNAAGTTAVLNVVPDTAPGSAQTRELVEILRQPGFRDADGAHLLVGGPTAMSIDVSRKLGDATLPYLALIVGLAFLLLVAVFRSVLVPLKAALGFLLSIAAALGAVVAVFQWGWLGSLFGVSAPAPVMSMMPIFMIGVVFGLAMDYEVFLVTRMREAYVHGQSPNAAISSGFEHSARVVTAAAIIMIAVFSGFMGSSEQMVKTIGLGLAVAVLLDAFLVRMTLVPAALALLGHRAWWLPRWLDRIVPTVDVEGTQHTAPDPTSAPPKASTATERADLST